MGKQQLKYTVQGHTVLIFGHKIFILFPK